MLDTPPPLRIHRGHRRAAPALLERFRGVQTGPLVDAMDGYGALDWRIKPLDPAAAAFVGSALTAWCAPADVLGAQGALMEAQAGDAVIAAAGGHTGTAVIGDLLAGMLRNRGVAAFVTDGLVRDRAGIVATGLPTFGMGVSPNSPASSGPAVVGAPIVCGGVAVRSGDILVGDADGVVVVPLERAEAVLERLTAVLAAEARAMAAVAAGATESERVRQLVAGAEIVLG